VEVRVDNPAKRVDLAIDTSKKRYNPGEKVSGSVIARDGNGNPVKSEISLAVVDESVWSLSRVSLAESYETFYRPRNLQVHTSQSLTKSMDRINANISLGSKGGSGGGCFTGDSLITMSDGSLKQFSEVAPGDNILTKENENSNNKVKARVSKVFIHDVDGYLVLNNNLKVTGVHIVYSDKGWVRADELEVGSKLLGENNKWVKV
jgi:hypothetical protein